VTQHVPDPGEHTRHYFGYYSNAARGKRRQMAAGDGADGVADGLSDDSETEDFRRECRRSWARLIQKVYQVDPLVCPDCGGRLEIVAFIDASQTIRKILEHLELWALPARPPPAPLVQGKIDAFTARSSRNCPEPAENADGVFVDDVPVYPTKRWDLSAPSAHLVRQHRP